jgi:hypothetical protein
MKPGYLNVRKKIIVAILLLLLVAFLTVYAVANYNLNFSKAVGQEVDQINGVKVFYNGGINHSSGRNLAPDGYNIGIKYQCVEFVKRYYFEHFGHKMPDPRGNAKDFFDPLIANGEMNPRRGLVQYRNGSSDPPRTDDLLVFGPSFFNPYGHVAIVAKVDKDSVEIIQQNSGPFANSRAIISLAQSNGSWTLDNSRVLGWLRRQDVHALGH